MNIAIIPARKGSKRLPNKNVCKLDGKPLICWTIEAALKCSFLDEIIVTSDDNRVFHICKRNNYNVKVAKRPEQLAQDGTKLDEVIVYTLRHYALDTTVILLQPTTPFRTYIDIMEAFKMYKKHFPLPVVSAYWYGNIDSRIRINGGIYITDLGSLVHGQAFIKPITIFYLMPYERSVDINNETDWYIAEALLEKGMVHGT